MYTVCIFLYIYIIYMCVCVYAYVHTNKKFIMAEIMRMRMFKIILTSV